MNVVATDLPLAFMKMRLLTEGLDELLARFERSGVIPSAKRAGAARPAMIAAGLALHTKDMLFGTRRDLSAAVARGLDLGQVMLQVLGREGDPTLGRALPGGVKSAESRVVLADGNVASHTMHAAGFGHAAQLRSSDAISLAMFGGAAQPNGELHGALNFAAVYKARTVFLCRGLLGDELPFKEAEEAWGMPVISVDGHDCAAVHDALQSARQRAVEGMGPSLIDARVTSEGGASVDAKRLQHDGKWATEVQAKVRAQVSEALKRARAAAESAAPISNTTLGEAVFAERPWFL